MQKSDEMTGIDDKLIEKLDKNTTNMNEARQEQSVDVKLKFQTSQLENSSTDQFLGDIYNKSITKKSELP